jgi:4-carboxymuconolactone decarboxylase
MRQVAGIFVTDLGRVSINSDLMVMLMTTRRTRSMAAMVAVTMIVVVMSSRINSQERMLPIPTDKMNDAQKKAFADYLADRPSGPFSPWWVYLRIPEITIPLLRLHEHVHAQTRLGDRLTHFAILIAGREWTQQVIWSLHYDDAIKSGLKKETISDLAAGRRPEHMADDEAVLYDFCVELQHNKSVSDATYAKALAKFGEDGVVETVLLEGLYTLLSMNMNTMRAPLPAGKTPLLGPLPK